ncbi:MAG: NAD-dependent epimerase/dehydratase family protein [Planctomycetota bacterium]
MRAPVVITGAAGFVGRNLARHLAAAGVPLTLVSLREDRELAALPGVTPCWGPPDETLGRLDLGAAAALVHLASRTNPQVGTALDEVRQLEELARLLATAPPGLRVVFCSSGGTLYGDGPGPHREQDPPAPTCAHAWGKLAAEELLRLHARQRGLRPTILRVTNLYGPHQRVRRQGIVMRLLEDLAAGAETPLWGDGRQLRDYLFVGDLCRLVQAALAHEDPAGTFNVGSGRATSLETLIAEVGRAVGRAPRVARAAGPMGVRASALDLGAVAARFGWRATTSLPEGLRATWAWLVESRLDARAPA